MPLRYRDVKVGDRLVAGPNCIYCLRAGNEYLVTEGNWIRCNEGPHELAPGNFDDGDFSLAAPLTPFESEVQAYIRGELNV